MSIPMRFLGYQLEYEAGGRTRAVTCRAGEPLANGELELAADFDGCALHLEASARCRLRILRCRILLEHRFAPEERVLVNGYQSWTATRELPPGARMRGLRGVPRAIVERFVLDGSGDYRFHGYDGRPGHLHGWSYAHLRRGGSYELVASLDETRGFTLVEMRADEGTVALEPEPPARVLEPGETVPLGSWALLRGGRDEVYDTWFSRSGVHARPIAPLVGYSSWYRHYGNIDEACILHDLEATVGALSGFDLGGCTGLFQVDDGWAKVGDWLEPDASSFPRGMEALALEIAGVRPGRPLLPGLWLAPFVCERDSRLFASHPDWLLRDAQGRPVRTGSHWSGAYALDTLKPEVRDYVRTVVRTATREWGFRFLKLDFLYAACMLPHGGLNRGELMADAISLLRGAAGDGVLLDGCGVPLASAFGKLDYCRVGCDVGLDWDGAPPMRLLERERVSTRNSLACTAARAPLDGRAFGCDPDVVFLRGDVRLSAEQRASLLETDASCASMLLSSDDMGAWDEHARSCFQRAIRRLAERRGR